MNFRTGKMAPSMTTMLCLLPICLDAVAALPRSSAGVRFGHVSMLQPDSLTELPADADFMGLQRHVLLRPASASEVPEDTADFADASLLGLQKSASLRRL